LPYGKANLVRFPPYRLDPDALFLWYMATFLWYMATAEFGFHQVLGWGQPARAIDLYTEFRHVTNDARVKSSGLTKREKGYYSLPGCLRYFEEDEIDVGHKKDMRQRILAGPPFSNAERQEIEQYGRDDVLALIRVARKLLPLIWSLPHALHRAQFGWALARQETRGSPTDQTDMDRLREHWDDIQVDLVRAVDTRYQCYEIVGGVPHFRDHLLLEYAHRQNIDWPMLETDPSVPDKRAETFRNLALAYPQVGDLHELRTTLAQLRKNKLAIGRDGRNRCLLGLFGTKTGRNAPGSSEYIFGPAKCFRFLIAPPPDTGLIYRDFSQQEVRIAAIKSRDAALLAACESGDGDVYLGVAEQLGFNPHKPGIRDLFKIVVLAINYGGGPHMLAALTGLSPYQAGEIIARLKARFHTFCDWCDRVADWAGLHLYLINELGWVMHCPPGSPARTIRNYLVQSCGSAIMHTFCILAERRGIEVVAPLHDGFLVQGPLADIRDVSVAVDRCMRRRSRGLRIADQRRRRNEPNSAGAVGRPGDSGGLRGGSPPLSRQILRQTRSQDVSRDRPASGSARTENGVTAFILDPDDPLYEDPAALERRRRSRLLRSEQPFAKVELPDLLDRRYRGIHSPKARLYLYLQVKTRNGRSPVRVTNAMAADLGLDRHRKSRCLHELEKIGAVRVERSGLAAPMVWWQRLRDDADV